MRRQQVLNQKQVSAYDYKAVYDIFHMTIEGLEKYIEVSGYYPNWENRKQIHDNNTIVDGLDDAEKSFTVSLFGFKKALRDTPPSLQEKIKEEYYKWINATGINVSNCPERLKHWLFEINEVIEGKGENFSAKTALWAHENVQKMDDEEFSRKMNEAFASIQNPLNRERGVAKTFEGQSWNQINLESKFGVGSSEQGEKDFDQIAKEIANRHDDFHYHQKDKQPVNPQQLTNSQVIQEFKNNRQDWRIDEVITEYDNLGRATKREQALIHKSAEIGLDGTVYGSQPVYPVQRFNQEEIRQINEILNSSQKAQSQTQTSTSGHRGGKGGGSGGLGGYGSSVVYGSFAVISLIGLAFVK